MTGFSTTTDLDDLYLQFAGYLLLYVLRSIDDLFNAGHLFLDHHSFSTTRPVQ